MFERAVQGYGKNSWQAKVYEAQLAELLYLANDPNMPIDRLVFVQYGIDVDKLLKFAEEHYNEITEFECRHFDCDKRELPRVKERFYESLPKLEPEQAERFVQRAYERVRERVEDFFAPEQVGEVELVTGSGVVGGYNYPIDEKRSRILITLNQPMDRFPSLIVFTLSHELLHCVGYKTQFKDSTPENKAILLNTIHVPAHEGIANSWRALYEGVDDFVDFVNSLLPEGIRVTKEMHYDYHLNFNRNRAYLFTIWHNVFVKGMDIDKAIQKVHEELGIPVERVKKLIGFQQAWTAYYTTYIVSEGIVAPELMRAKEEGGKEGYRESVLRLAVEPKTQYIH